MPYLTFELNTIKIQYCESIILTMIPNGIVFDSSTINNNYFIGYTKIKSRKFATICHITRTVGKVTHQVNIFF